MRSALELKTAVFRNAVTADDLSMLRETTYVILFEDGKGHLRASLEVFGAHGLSVSVFILLEHSHESSPPDIELVIEYGGTALVYLDSTMSRRSFFCKFRPVFRLL